MVDNDITYSMPEFVRYPVRDRQSWEFFKRRTTPPQTMPRQELDARARPYDGRTQPLVTFPNLCRFTTLLHDVTGNPEGEFPRM